MKRDPAIAFLEDRCQSMEPEIIGIAQKLNTRNINERVAITELLGMGASWTGMVACWWATMLMQGGIFFTTLETKDRLFIIVIFLFICFCHGIYFCPQATWYSTEANRSLWANNIQQLALPIGCISTLFYWCKLVSAIICAVLSMLQLVSQDFGQTEEANMASQNFALNVFYVLALIETLLLLLALMLRMLFERVKEEKKEQKKEEKDDEKKAERNHEIIEIPDKTNTFSQQHDSSDRMQNNNGDDTSHKLTGKGAPGMFDSLKKWAFMETKSKWWAEMMYKRWLGMLPSSECGKFITLIWAWVVVILVSNWIGFTTLESKNRLFITVIFIFSLIGCFLHCFLKTAGSLTKANWSLWANKIQHKRRLFPWFQLVSVWFFVLSMMGLYSQYYGQTEVTNMVTRHTNLHFLYFTTIAIPAFNFVNIIIIMRQTVTEELFEGATDQSEDMHMELTELMKDQSARIPQGSKRRHAYGTNEKSIRKNPATKCLERNVETNY